jgi:hypothetical protein
MVLTKLILEQSRWHKIATLKIGMSVATDIFQDMGNLQGFEGLSALEESAVRLHEIYKSLIAGGFTEDQALTLIAKMTRSGSDT